MSAVQTQATEKASGYSIAANGFIVITASLLIAISAQFAVTLPYAAAPVTLQPLALLLIGGALGWRRAALAAFLYLLEGAAGLPVFSQGGGALKLIGPTAGFLYAFPAAAAIAGAPARTFVARLALMLTAIGALYLGGWGWLAGPLGRDASFAFSVGVAPFIAGDLCKAALAALLITALKRR